MYRQYGEYIIILTEVFFFVFGVMREINLQIKIDMTFVAEYKIVLEKMAERTRCL